MWSSVNAAPVLFTFISLLPGYKTGKFNSSKTDKPFRTVFPLVSVIFAVSNPLSTINISFDEYIKDIFLNSIKETSHHSSFEYNDKVMYISAKNYKNSSVNGILMMDEFDKFIEVVQGVENQPDEILG